MHLKYIFSIFKYKTLQKYSEEENIQNAQDKTLYCFKVFPFFYDGTNHTTCINRGVQSGHYWCGLQYNVAYSISSSWGYCNMDHCDTPEEDSISPICHTTSGNLCVTFYFYSLLKSFIWLRFFLSFTMGYGTANVLP